ncbi:MAG: flagellar motor protein MotB [Pseudomonadota bacterium]
MSEEGQTVILRPKKVVEGEHHSSAWKVAYADFATAMMAFFLMMWLLNATSEEQRQGLADYFDPSIPLTPSSGGGEGMMGGTDPFTPSPMAGTVPEGVRPDPRQTDPGEDLGEDTASPPGIERPGLSDDRAGSPLEGPMTETGIGPQEALEAALMAAGGAEAGDHLRVRLTSEGLLIELVDLVGEPLFASGSAQPEPLLTELIALIAPIIIGTQNQIAVIGHTDARPFSRGDYSNWELSADRANRARRLLLINGIETGRIARVEGRAASQPLIADAMAAENRRIAIKLLTMPR